MQWKNRLEPKHLKKKSIKISFKIFVLELSNDTGPIKVKQKNVSCFQVCSDLLSIKKNDLVIQKNFWNFRLKADVENFYLLKIHLNLFETSDQVLEFENLIQIWKSFLPSENLFQTGTLGSGAMCMYSSLSHDKVEYTHIAPLRRVHVWNKCFQI